MRNQLVIGFYGQELLSLAMVAVYDLWHRTPFDGDLETGRYRGCFIRGAAEPMSSKIIAALTDAGYGISWYSGELKDKGVLVLILDRRCTGGLSRAVVLC